MKYNRIICTIICISIIFICPNIAIANSHVTNHVIDMSEFNEINWVTLHSDVVEVDIIDDVDPDDTSTWYYPMTYDELYELATLVYLEGGIESIDCQKGIASVVINRATTSGKSTHDVIYAKHQFTPAKYITTSKPSDSTLEAAKHVAMHGPTIPEYVTYFRADYYFDWGERYQDYIQIDNTYFSYDTVLKSKVGCTYE